MTEYRIFSNAKINIGLNVFQKESDGFHNIDSIMAPIDLYDEMEITFYSGIGDLKIECSDSSIPTDERNILYKTYKVFFEESKREKEKISILRVANSNRGEKQVAILIRLCMVGDWCLDHLEYMAKIEGYA